MTVRLGPKRSLYLLSPYWWIQRVVTKYIDTIGVPYAFGRLLDIGCGRKPYAEIFAPQISWYIGIDRDSKSEADVCADVAHLPFPTKTFDTVLSTQVLEHVADPEAVVREAARVLNAKGVLILTVPHICRVHGAPFDYQRYTKFGVIKLLESCNLEPVVIQEMGGFWIMCAYMLTFYIAESLIPSLMRKGHLYSAIARALPLCYLPTYKIFERLDSFHFDADNTFNYIVVARRTNNDCDWERFQMQEM